MNFLQILQLLQSENEEDKFTAALELRYKTTSNDTQIDSLISAGVVPKLVDLLEVSRFDDDFFSLGHALKISFTACECNKRQFGF